MTRDEALQKIKKCLALAASPEQHEAASALRQAQKLMQLFGLTETDVSLADVSEVTQRASSAPLVLWETWLAHLVAEGFGCDYFTSTHMVLGSNFTRRTVREYVFIGVGTAAEVAGYAFEVLSRQCAKDRRAHVAKQPKNCKQKTKVARGDRYAEGWVQGVREKLETFTRTDKESALVAQYKEQHHPSLQSAKVKDRTTGRNVTDADFGHGFLAGREAEIHHGVGGKAQQGLIGG